MEIGSELQAVIDKMGPHMIVPVEAIAARRPLRISDVISVVPDDGPAHQG